MGAKSPPLRVRPPSAEARGGGWHETPPGVMVVRRDLQYATAMGDGADVSLPADLRGGLKQIRPEAVLRCVTLVPNERGTSSGRTDRGDEGEADTSSKADSSDVMCCSCYHAAAHHRPPPVTIAGEGGVAHDSQVLRRGPGSTEKTRASRHIRRRLLDLSNQQPPLVFLSTQQANSSPLQSPSPSLLAQP
ncbi:hypothetical protein A1Q2_05549 [Trichosporon asahii var. asahii CBS 8904]|uniref:Uncharacterized protein n=1 Tax=Trichosporon asahii var. asahii (strain CBS 8904) TaxID=1220162 RepID=K1VHA4_TRIAC|nr:hypothetical protein A1Q2_05549 [Trichosporon asahii var. asahii CBS 8904]